MEKEDKEFEALLKIEQQKIVDRYIKEAEEISKSLANQINSLILKLLSPQKHNTNTFSREVFFYT